MIDIRILVFFLLGLISVSLLTLKSILTVKASKPIAAIINAVAFGFDVIVIKQLIGFDLVTTVLVTVATNLIGVWLSITLLNKVKKDDLWKITVVSKREADTMAIKIAMEHQKIGYTIVPMSNGGSIITIYCYKQMETAITKDVLKSTKAKYHYAPVNTL